MTARYKSSDVNVELTNDDIHSRYQDTAMVIFKEHQRKTEVSNYLSYGNSRRTIEYSNYGNQPVIIRRHVGMNNDLTSQVLRIYRKPQETCAITPPTAPEDRGKGHRSTNFEYQINILHGHLRCDRWPRRDDELVVKK